MKIAILTTDNREAYRQYAAPTPYFGTAPTALFQGFAALPNLEVHILMHSTTHALANQAS
jgi:hypothetical protein